MKRNNTVKLLTVLALLGLVLSAPAEELKPVATGKTGPATAPVAAKTTKPTPSANAVPAAGSVAAKPTPNPQATPAVPAVKKLPTDGLVHTKPVEKAAVPVVTPPAPVAEGPQTHIVRKGETLGGIAHRSGVSTKSLALWNHMVDPNKLSIGQRVEIPPSSAAPRAVKPPKGTKTAAPTATTEPAKAESAADADTIRITLQAK